MTGRRRDRGGLLPAVTGAGVRIGGNPPPPANDEQRILRLSDDAALLTGPRTVRLRRRGRSGLVWSLSVPIAWYRGVAVDVEIDAKARLEGVRVILAHDADPGLDVTLHQSVDDRDAVAAWRGWARDLGLPMLMRTEAGDELARPRFGALDIGPAHARRAPRAFLARRPKALRRRKVGLAPPRRSASVS